MNIVVKRFSLQQNAQISSSVIHNTLLGQIKCICILSTDFFLTNVMYTLHTNNIQRKNENII